MRIIVYTQRVEIIESYGERRDCADQRIADLIYECGFIPIPLPNDDRIVDDIISSLQPAGIILTGGNSLVKYGGNAPERDKMDKALIRITIEKKIPLYGFCRGMQSILDYFGNELMNVVGHVTKKHNILMDNKVLGVNSYHNQGCKEIVPDSGLVATALSEDCVIEMIEHKNYPIMATMWHPERETPYKEEDIKRIKKFFEEK